MPVGSLYSTDVTALKIGIQKAITSRIFLFSFSVISSKRFIMEGLPPTKTNCI